MNQYYTSADHFALLPGLLLALFGCAMFIVDFVVVPEPKQKKWLIVFVVIAEAFVGMALYRQHSLLSAQSLERITAFHGALTIDGFALFFNAVFVITSVLVCLISYRYFEIEQEHHGEFYGLALLAQCGMFFLAAATELVTAFIGLELMAITFYVLVGFLRSDRRSNEAALKYLILGALSSGLLVYGFSLLYGLSGSTRLPEIASAMSQRDPWDPICFLALVTISAGLLFKVGAAPFHMWAPDAYEGAPTTVTAFLAVGSKAASFAFLLRIMLGPLGSSRLVWEPLFIGVALLSLTIGNFAALSQTNLKRLLAYSSISHAGYILLGVIAGNNTGLQGVAVYILVYVFMTIGAFLVITALRRQGLLGEDVDDLAGLIHKSPVYAVLMLIFLLSLAGIPPTAGFVAKYFIFLSLIETGHYWLAAIAALYVAVAVFYYFRIVRSMFQSEQSDFGALSQSTGVRVALAVTGALTLLIGVYPEPFLLFARTSLLR